MAMDFKIIKMTPSDWPEVSKIYTLGIETGLATFQTEAPSYEDWDNGHISACRLVAKIADQVIGWAALSPVSSRCVYAGVAEVSIYIDPAFKGMHVGTVLLNALIEASEAEGFWTLQSGIIKENESSIKLHEKCGFRVIGYREKVGKMPTGKWHDVVLVEKRSTKF